MALLRVIDGPDNGRIFVLKKFPATLGRDPECIIRLSDPGVSGVHGHIERERRGFTLVDLQSRNGLFLNGKSVAKAALKDGDQIGLGHGTIQFRDQGSEASAARTTISIVRPYRSLQDIAETSESDRKLGRAYKLLSVLFDLDRSLSEENTREALTGLALRVVQRLLPCERVAVILTDPDSGELFEPCVCSPREAAIDLKSFDGAYLHALITGRSVHVDDSRLDPRFSRDKSLRSLIGVPMIAHGRVYGLIHADASQPERFQVGDLRLVNTLAAKLAVAVSNLRHARQLKNMFQHTVATLVNAIQAKDKYTRGHSERVRRYARIMGEALNLPAREQELLEVSAVLHDVGKIGMPDRILIENDDPLTEEELATVKKHPLQGARLLRKIPELEGIIPGIKWHHEDWGGGGYPDNLSGEDIPLQARIVAIADTYDAVTTDRPYQKGVSKLDGLKILKKLKGTRLDPKLVDLFAEAVTAKKSFKRWSKPQERTSRMQSAESLSSRSSSQH